MTRALKVYGWASFRQDCPPSPNGSTQVRYIVAAGSWAAAARAVPGESLRHMTTYGSTTGNDGEVEQAMRDPGVAFWHPLDERPPNWRRVQPGVTARSGG